MKINKLFLIPILLLSCVNNNLPQNNILSPIPSISSSSQSTVISSSPTLLPTPTITPKPIINNTEKKFKIGLSNTFYRITNSKSPDKVLDKKNTILIINDLLVDGIIIDFNQNIVDKNLDGDIEDDNGEFPLYNEIIEELGNKNVFFRINFKNLPSSNTSPKLSEFLSFFEKVNEKLKNYKNISWIIEDRINNKNLNPEPEIQLVDFVKKAHSIIKKYNKDSKVYLGSLMQSELFSKRVSYAADNLLNYLNLGIADYCDGFILEFYNVLSSNSFLPSDYKIIFTYFNLIKNTLSLKSINNKELFLITSTYSGNILVRQEEDKDNKETFYNIGDLQTEQQQSGLIIRNIIYGIYSGFDYIFLPKIFDDNEDILEVISKSGIIDKVSENDKDLSQIRKKLSYWSIKFLNKILANSKFIKKIDSSYKGVEIFLFENDKKFFYIIWNDFADINTEIKIDLANSKGINHLLPYDNNTKEGISIPFSLDKKELIISFSINSYIPRIIEVEK